ncbi:MAG: cation:proton antiporter, partial [Methanosarcinaceae archaeon]|nr:cation:proton antiporter [Methanosarcinaceae archaeon]
MVDTIFLLGLVVAVLVMSLLAQALSRYFQVPVIIFLLIEGIIAGPEVLNLLDPSIYVGGLSVIVAISVAIIVFDGGLHIDLKEVRMIQETVMKLTTIGVLITFLGVTVLTNKLIDIPLELAALFGALVTATGPTVITPIVRQIQVSHKVSKILELEGILNDAASVILAAMVFEWIASELTGIEALLFILYRLGIGLVAGAVCGYALRHYFTRGKVIRKQTARLVTLTSVLACYVVSEMLGNESGILAVAVFGIILGTSKFPHKEAVKEFKGDIVSVLLSL